MWWFLEVIGSDSIRFHYYINIRPGQRRRWKNTNGFVFCDRYYYYTICYCVRKIYIYIKEPIIIQKIPYFTTWQMYYRFIYKMLSVQNMESFCRYTLVMSDALWSNIRPIIIQLYIILEMRTMSLILCWILFQRAVCIIVEVKSIYCC